MTQSNIITRNNLLLPYDQWTQWVQITKSSLSMPELSWLNRWNLWDLASSPMDDNERRLIRYGHYLGWLHADQPIIDCW